MSGLLLDTHLSNEQREFAEIIRSSGDALLTIINDILDFSKIEAGRMELETQPFDLRECVEAALDLMATRAYEKGLDLAYSMDENVPQAIQGDVTRLRQILLNLLSNAIKFTETGEVVVEVNLAQPPFPFGEAEYSQGGQGERSSLHISVRDSVSTRLVSLESFHQRLYLAFCALSYTRAIYLFLRESMLRRLFGCPFPMSFLAIPSRT